ncbi:MAG: hypothetical protein EZS28_007266 [Streblomastix strix]|uniref:Uncharacterized protein n=1 Tax=Streblomastix strix TaxID=222440 RepID=A0A5J4WQ98_9EUKA|nr:MAG: hypothetical protein EZS28_007266 [Streblomastix strix]
MGTNDDVPAIHTIFEGNQSPSKKKKKKFIPIPMIGTFLVRIPLRTKTIQEQMQIMIEREQQLDEADGRRKGRQRKRNMKKDIKQINGNDEQGDDNNINDQDGQKNQNKDIYGYESDIDDEDEGELTVELSSDDLDSVNMGNEVNQRDYNGDENNTNITGLQRIKKKKEIGLLFEDENKDGKDRYNKYLGSKVNEKESQSIDKIREKQKRKERKRFILGEIKFAVKLRPLLNYLHSTGQKFPPYLIRSFYAHPFLQRVYRTYEATAKPLKDT